jgi:hypothetical protein
VSVVSLADGGSFTDRTVMVTVAGAERSLPSFAANVNESNPL